MGIGLLVGGVAFLYRQPTNLLGTLEAAIAVLQAENERLKAWPLVTGSGDACPNEGGAMAVLLSMARDRPSRYGFPGRKAGWVQRHC